MPDRHHNDPTVRQDPVTGDRVVTQPAADPAITREIRRDAYEAGRADERSRHKRNPLLTLLIAIAAVFGLAVIGLYIYNGGSFTAAGRDLDTVAGRAEDKARDAGAEVADETGEGMQDLGRNVEQVGEQNKASSGQTSPQAPQTQGAPARR